MPVFKVWCSKREQKKSIVTESFDFNTFLDKVKAKFLIPDKVALVLEEDGTEVEDAESLEAFTHHILMVLPDGALWTSAAADSIFTSPTPSQQQSVHEPPGTPRPTWNREELRESTPRSMDATFATTPQRRRKAWCESFSIPWQQLPTNLLRKLERSVGREAEPEVKLNKNEFNEVIRTVVSEIRTEDTYPGRKALRKVAESMSNKFKVLADLDEEGKKIGSGLGTLTIKLEEHNNYLNRPSKTSSLMTLASSPAGPDGRRKRKAGKKTAQCGTVDWQPEYPPHETVLSQAEKKKWLISESRKSTKDRDSEKINLYMEDTYASQRLFLNKSEIGVEDLKKEWPLLLEPEYLKKHCQKLITNFNDKVEYWSEDKMKKIIYLVEERITVEKAKAIQEKNEETRREKMALADEGVLLVNFAKKSPVIGALNLIMHKFSERQKGSRHLLVDIQEGSTRDEILAAPRSPSPCIVIVGPNMYEGTYYVLAENTIISTHSKPAEAITMVYCLHFLFNMEYPKALGHSWDFMQRYLFRNNPDPEEGSKNPKRKRSENMAGPVNTFMRDILRYTVTVPDVVDEDTL